MPVPHDPAHHARLIFRWRDKKWHLLDEPSPAVVLISNSVSQGHDFPTPETAEEAFWANVADSILAEENRLASATWPGVEIAAVLDKATNRAVVVERTRRGDPQVQLYDDKSEALAAFQGRVHSLITKCETAA